MRVTLQLNGYHASIDTRVPETLAAWLIEQFDAIAGAPNPWITVQIHPGWFTSQSGRVQPDWVADSRITRQLAQVRTPEDVAAVMLDQLRVAHELRAGPDSRAEHLANHKRDGTRCILYRPDGQP